MNHQPRSPSRTYSEYADDGLEATEPGPAELWHRAFMDLLDGVARSIDPFGMTAPIVHARIAWAAHPKELGDRMVRLSSDLWRLQTHTMNRMLGIPDADPIAVAEGDVRFSDPVWTELPTFDLMKEWYLAFTRHTLDMLHDTPGMSGKDRKRAAFWWRNWLNAVAPTNCLLTNPVAMRKAVESHGQSLVRGFGNFLEDLVAGDLRMTDPEDFKVGENLATTPGAVVMRNRLLELIHYSPTQTLVHAKPVVIVTPWINKFYVLDLAPKKSMIRYLLDQGMDVFVTSWKNPDASMSDVRFDDYLLDGVHAAVETARALTGAPRVHAVGYCIGGTALAMYMAWANRRFAPEEVPVADWTLLATLIDFRAPGEIEVFIDESSVRSLCDAMARKGCLDGREMAAAFRLLRANSLIWNYVVNGWLYGETPPPFDVLYWNMDTTRMPQAMHSWYLRELYLNNRLIRPDALTVAGEPLDLQGIRQPLYAVAAEDDHIAPWRQAFRIHRHLEGEKRFVLSSSGHILGIVNPVVTPPKRSYRAASVSRSDRADGWLARTGIQAGSWWEDWMEWLKPRAGKRVRARPAASAGFPELAPAPGCYVMER